MEQRMLLYEIYRLSNAAHALCYQSVSPTLSTLGLDEFVDKLNLLTNEEMDNLCKYERKLRDGVLGLLSNRVCTLANADNFSVGWQHIFPYVNGVRGTAFVIIIKLRNPFSWTKDRIQVDELLASTDLNLFTTLRLSFTGNEGFVYSDKEKRTNG
ncbi:MAG: hypothetical protein SGBAC_011814 [Bacillariaceae sp.]